MRLRQDTPAHVEQLHLAFWNPSLHKASLVGPRAFQTPWGQARDGLRKGTVVGPLVELAGEEERNFCSSVFGLEQL